MSKVKNVKSRDVSVSPKRVLSKALNHAKDIHEVAVVTLNSDGSITVASSFGSPHTLNLLAQAILTVDGTIPPAE